MARPCQTDTASPVDARVGSLYSFDFNARVPGARGQCGRSDGTVLISSEGLRPSDSPTRALARRGVGALRSRGSLAVFARSAFVRWPLVS